ncbi:MAG: hypothetical protein LLG14_10145 [Nocardiaceae bacterium]|nr:hypothetical protein [Nocardiaceae bacterium]
MRWIGPLTLLFLTIDGFVSCVVEALYLPSYIGSIPFPISVLFAAVGNIVLMWAASKVNPRPLVAFLPVIAWTFAMVIMLAGGHGGDFILWAGWQTIAFCVGGLLPPLIFSALRPIPDQRPAPPAPAPTPASRASGGR